MWTEITRRQYEREGQRYASDVTDAEWALIEPHMPAVKRLGRPRETELRAVLDAILYIARTGCQWRMLPKEDGPAHDEAVPAERWMAFLEQASLRPRLPLPAQRPLQSSPAESSDAEPTTRRGRLGHLGYSPYQAEMDALANLPAVATNYVEALPPLLRDRLHARRGPR
jgi:hypothetical protein